MPVLHYEPSPSARPVVVEQLGDVTRVVVLMRWPSMLLPQWAMASAMLSPLLIPLVWIAALLVRMYLRLPTPPRAVFEIDREHVKLTLRDPVSAETSTFVWPRAAILEARANRFEGGLWMNVAGHVKETYLSELPRETIEKLEAELRIALDGQA